MRRRTWMILGLMTALALPAAAQAGHRDAQPRDAYDDDCDRPSRSGYVTVRNPNRQDLEVFVDGRPAGTVLAGDSLRVGPVSAGRHQVEARYVCNRRHLTATIEEATVYVNGRRSAQLRIPYTDLGIVTVKNTWVQPMRLEVDGQRVGRIKPGKKFSTLARRGARIEASLRHGAVAMSATSHASGLDGQQMAVVAPRLAKVAVYNPAPVPLKLVDAQTGETFCRVAARSTEWLTLESGIAQLQARFRGEAVAQTRILANPWAQARWSIALPDTAALTVRNDNPVAVQAFANGQLLGWVDAGEQVVFDDVQVGQIQVSFEARRRRGIIEGTQNVRVAPLLGGEASIALALRDGRHSRRDRHARSERTTTHRRHRGWSWSGYGGIARR